MIFLEMANAPQPISIRDKICSFDRALDAKDVAKLFNISVPMLYKQCESEAIPHFRVGTAIRFDPKKLHDWYELQ